jgi:hypothetical protein
VFEAIWEEDGAIFGGFLQQFPALGLGSDFDHLRTQL